MLFKISTTKKVQQTQLKLELPFIKRTFRIMFQLYRTPDTWTSGISSVCADGRHTLFFDYDKVDDISRVEQEIKFIQEELNLSHAYIFTTNENTNFHVIILDKHSLRETFNIIKETNVDYAFLTSIKIIKGREWILRIDEKGKRPRPVFVKVLKSLNQEKEISTAHKIFLQKYYGVPKLKYKFEDNNTIIPLVNYNTGNRVL